MRLAVPPGFPGRQGQRPPALSRLRIWFTASMGFLTDAYDLFVIGAIIDIFNAYGIPGFHDPRLEAILASSAIFAAIAGQLAMGRISDAFGRKFIYGVEAMLLASGAILSVLGALATLLLREPARRTLEEASREETVPIEVGAARAARTTRRWGVRG